MGMRILATCVAILALGVAAVSALAAAPNDSGADRLAASGHTQEQLDEALKAIGPQDPSIVPRLIKGCEDLASKGIGSALCADLLSEAGVDVKPEVSK